MIAKKIGRRCKDNFGRLAEYIADAPEKGEKLAGLWTVNCGDDETDLDLAVAGIEATQTLNTRSGIDKTYHLLISFRPGERPSLEEMRDIERNFTEALGFGEHQRVAGGHDDTNNFHIHVAINKVHPETLAVHTPWNDYKALEKTCRALERKYGLYVDLGKTDYGGYRKFRDVASPAARDFEAHTWRQSFQNQVLDDRERIAMAAGKARDWQGLHKALGKLDLEIVQRGNGLVLRRAGGREAVKASLVDRSLSGEQLKERLGPFEAAAAKPKPRRRYRARPLGRHPGASRLWRNFVAGRKRPKTLVGRIAADWKQFLMNEAYRDPLALVIIIAYKEMLHMLTGGPARVPKAVRPALRHWMEKGEWLDGGTSPWLKPGTARGLGLKEDGGGNLLVPFRDKDGHIWGLQALRPDGKTMAIGDVRKSGLLHVIDPDRRLAATKGKDAPAVVLADGPATAAAVRKATRAPVALLPPDGNMKAAVRSLRARNRGCDVVAVGDRGFAERATAAGIEAEVLETGKKAMKPAVLRARLAPLVGDRVQMAWLELKGAPWATPGNTAWLKQNNVRGFGLKLAADGDVAMPLKDVHGRLHGVKFIGADGDSRRVGGDGELPPLMHLIDPYRRAGEDALVVAGDYLSGAAIHGATRLPVAVADEPERIGEVARVLRGRYSDIKLVIAADKEQARGLKETATESRAVPVSPPDGAASFAEQAGDSDKIRDVLAGPAGDVVWRCWRAAEPLGKDTPEGLPPGLPADGLRRDKDGKVLVPLTDVGGRVRGLCALDARGEIEDRTATGETAGLMHVVGREKAGGKGDVVIAEDLASAAAIHEATGRSALCAFGSENLEAVATAWRGKHPKAEIAVAATDNNAAARNASLDSARAAARAVGGKQIVPPSTEKDRAVDRTSFGDLWRDKSRRWDVRRQLEDLAGKDQEPGIEF